MTEYALGGQHGLPDDFWEVMALEQPDKFHELVEDQERVIRKLHVLYDEYLAEPMEYPEVEKTPFSVWKNYQPEWQEWRAKWVAWRLDSELKN